MWMMMIISFITVSYLDTRGFSKLRDKRTLVFYSVLMTVSCFIGTASRYVNYMPSPADFIKGLVLTIIGK